MEIPFEREHANLRRSELLASEAFASWFDGSLVTEDGTRTGRPAMVFRGCRPASDAGAEDHTTRWFTTSRLNASFFEDGELQNAYLSLRQPLIIDFSPLCCRAPLRQIAEAALRLRAQGRICCDGVAFPDVVDGTHPGTTYAVFGDESTWAQRILVVGRTCYDTDGQPIFEGIQPDALPVSFGRSDRPRQSPPVRSWMSAQWHGVRTTE